MNADNNAAKASSWNIHIFTLNPHFRPGVCVCMFVCSYAHFIPLFSTPIIRSDLCPTTSYSSLSVRTISRTRLRVYSHASGLARLSYTRTLIMPAARNHPLGTINVWTKSVAVVVESTSWWRRKKSQGIVKVSMIQSLGTVNVGTKYHGNPSNSRRKIAVAEAMPPACLKIRIFKCIQM